MRPIQGIVAPAIALLIAGTVVVPGWAKSSTPSKGAPGAQRHYAPAPVVAAPDPEAPAPVPTPLSTPRAKKPGKDTASAPVPVVQDPAPPPAGTGKQLGDGKGTGKKNGGGNGNGQGQGQGQGGGSGQGNGSGNGNGNGSGNGNGNGNGNGDGSGTGSGSGTGTGSGSGSGSGSSATGSGGKKPIPSYTDPGDTPTTTPTTPVVTTASVPVTPTPAPVVTPAPAPAPPETQPVATPAPTTRVTLHHAKRARTHTRATAKGGVRAAGASGSTTPAHRVQAISFATGPTPRLKAKPVRRAARTAEAKSTPRTTVTTVTRVIRQVDHVVPGPLKAIVAMLVALAGLLGLRSRIAALHAHRLDRERRGLQDDVGLLQRALLPEVPADIAGLDVSVAYRPADGPAAGGDFYDVLELDSNRTALIVGDVTGHGRHVIATSALMRYTLRTYLAAGWPPRVALQLAGRALQSDPAAELTTVVVALYDARTGTLTYSCAGHEPPVIDGPTAHLPVTAASSAPLGGFMPTGRRQTTIALPPGSTVCLFTDGLVETEGGDRLSGRERLVELVRSGDGFGAQDLLERVAAAASATPDDMAACVLRTRPDAATSDSPRIEELIAERRDLEGPRVENFLTACGIPADEAAEALATAREIAAESRSAILRVTIGETTEVDVLEPAAIAAAGVSAAV